MQLIAAIRDGEDLDLLELLLLIGGAVLIVVGILALIDRRFIEGAALLLVGVLLATGYVVAAVVVAVIAAIVLAILRGRP